jgi:hypothetical protein
MVDLDSTTEPHRRPTMTERPFDPNTDPEASVEAEKAWRAQSTETCDHGRLLWQSCSGCNVLAWNPPVERTVEKWYELPGDPQVWGPAYELGIEQYGDNGTNCIMCGKRTGGRKQVALVLVSMNGLALPIQELPAGIDESSETLGCFPIGSECKKKLPAKYVITQS